MFVRLLQRLRGSPIVSRPSGGQRRIVIELSSFDKGGLEKVVLDTALAFDRERFAPLIVTPGALGHLAQQARAAGITVIQLPEKNGLRAYRDVLVQFAPDVALSHFSDVGYPLFSELGIPNITYIHNVYAFMPDGPRAAFRANDAHVTRYIAVSAKAAAYAEASLGISGEKIVTIPNGLIIAEHEQRERQPMRLTRQELGIREDDYVFINPASYNLHKAHYLMAAAMRRILAVRDDIRILCVGNEVFPPHVAALRDHIKQHDLDRHMLMPGYFPAIQDPMRLADACLLPSFIEGWSIAMNEAMFYGKPMILTDTGAAAEVIEDNDIGILLPTEYPDFRALDSATLDALAYEPRDYRLAKPLADAMMRFADERDNWARAGARARERLYARYDFKTTMKGYEDIITSITADRA